MILSVVFLQIQHSASACAIFGVLWLLFSHSRHFWQEHVNLLRLHLLCKQPLLVCIMYQILFSTYRPTDNTFKDFGGTVFKAHSNYSTPRSVRIQWMNFLEGDDVRDGTAFNMTMESNKIDETNFMISVSANCI